LPKFCTLRLRPHVVCVVGGVCYLLHTATLCVLQAKGPPMDANAATVTLLTAACHCAGAKLSFAVPITALPLRALACHCTNCRQSTGVLPHVTASLPGLEQPEQDLEEEERNGTLKHYQSSSLLMRWFCSRCGTHIVRPARCYFFYLCI
jgi:hypothetical protein